MFLEIKRTPMMFMQHKDMDSNYITPITSTFRINMGLMAELSIYSIKEEQQRKTLDNKDVNIPAGSHVIHIEMSYTHSTHKHHMGTPTEHSVNERYYYKLIFFPGADNEFLRIKSIIERATAQ